MILYTISEIYYLLQFTFNNIGKVSAAASEWRMYWKTCYEVF